MSASSNSADAAKTKDYDLIVIGSGQAGNPLAAAFSAQGKRVAMIERALVGGTCVNYGCTPTKAMVACAEVAHMARRAQEFGVHLSDVSVSLPEVIARKDAIVAKMRGSNLKKLEQTTDLIRGEASFTGPKQISVALTAGGTSALSADVIVIDTGLSPAPFELEGIETIEPLDNVSIMQLQSIPEHLLVLGGGYIGLEFAQMFRRFGAKITVIQAGAQLLEREDRDVAEEVAKLLQDDGINILLDSKATAVSKHGTQLELTVDGKDGSRLLYGTHLLVATGRHPNTGPLHLDAAGIKTDEHGFISVDDKLQTGVEGVYAVGDVKGGPAFTHIAYDDYRILRANLLEGKDVSIKGRQVPYCVFIDPQLGRIGLSEAEAKEQGLNYKVGCLPMDSVARAVETGHTRGFMKVVVDPDSKQILGAAILGAEGGEIMSMLQIAMLGKVPYTSLADGIFAHPLFAEALNGLFSRIDKDQ